MKGVARDLSVERGMEHPLMWLVSSALVGEGHPPLETLEKMVKEMERMQSLFASRVFWNFVDGLEREAAEEMGRSRSAPDQEWQKEDWFWLIGWVVGKALQAHIRGDCEKALHHTVSSAAVLINWQAAFIARGEGTKAECSDAAGATEQRPGVGPEEYPLLAEWRRSGELGRLDLTAELLQSETGERRRSLLRLAGWAMAMVLAALPEGDGAGASKALAEEVRELAEDVLHRDLAAVGVVQ